MPHFTPDRFARTIRTAIDETLADSDGRRSLVSRKLRTVLREAGGWKRRGSANLGAISTALTAEGVHTDWDLDDPDLTLDDYIRFSLKPIRRRRPRPRFRSEAELVRFIADNHRMLFRGVPELEGVRLVGTQVRFDSPRRKRADMVFRNAAGELIAVEVELADPQENSAYQVRKYMRASRAVLGVLITAQPSSAALEREMMSELELDPVQPAIWLQYDVSMRRVEPSG